MKFNDDIIGVVHAKGTSNRVKRKNFCLVQGVPLFLCQAINLANIIGKNNVFIDSESEEILFLSKENGFQTSKRNKKFSSNSTGGVALLENFISTNNINKTTVVQLFPPMPFINIEKFL